MASKIQDLIKDIGGLSVFELAELVKAVEETFGVSAASAMAVAAPSSDSDVSGSKEEEKTSFKVELVESGAEKIKVIKAVRAALPSLGLSEAKKAVDEVPFLLAESATKEDAMKMKESIEAAGAKVKLS